MGWTALDEFDAGRGDAPSVICVVARVYVEFADTPAHTNVVFEFGATGAGPMREVGLGRVDKIAVRYQTDLIDAESREPTTEVTVADGGYSHGTANAEVSIVQEETPIFGGPRG